jgi:sugar phosphate isomerase/epimerase
MKPRIALQLYSVRDLLPRDFSGVVRQVAKMGYQGVEATSNLGTTPKAAGKLFRELGLTVTSIHFFPPPVGKKFNEVLDLMKEFDCQHLVSGYGAEKFKTLDDIMRNCEEVNACYELYQAHGIQLSIHNHSHEYLSVEGIFPYKVMLENILPEVLFELDTYWILVAGVDPAVVIREMGARARLLHMKDGPGVKSQPNLAVGQGVLDVPAVLKASGGNAEWLIVEFDRCATDILVAVEESYQYLAKQ